MKSSLSLLKAGFAACLLSPLPAAGVTLIGQLDTFPAPPEPNPGAFSTIDYIEFYVDQPTQVTLSGRLTGLVGSIDMVAYPAFLGIDEFGQNVSSRLTIRTNSSVNNPTSFTTAMGRYFLVIMLSEGEWDRFEGLVPSSTTEPTPFQQNYEVTLTGGMRPVAFYEGQTDNTFKITALPEPGTAILCAFGALLPSRRRRHKGIRGR